MLGAYLSYRGVSSMDSESFNRITRFINSRIKGTRHVSRIVLCLFPVADTSSLPVRRKYHGSARFRWVGSFARNHFGRHYANKLEKQLAMVLACAIFSGKAFDAGYVRYLMVGGGVIYIAG